MSRPAVGTAKAARWTGLSERAIRRNCQLGRVEGAYQLAFSSKWLIPVPTLEQMCPCPEELRPVIYGEDN